MRLRRSILMAGHRAMGIRQPTTGIGRRGWVGLLFVVILVPVELLGQGEPQGLTATPPLQSTGQAKLTLEQRADVYMVRKAYADAADYYRRALKQDGSSNARVWNKLGMVCQNLGDSRAARQAYNEALRRRHDFAEALNNIGTTYFFEKRYSKSIKYYQRAIQINPDSATFHQNLGSAYFRKKKFKETLEEFRQALTLDPKVLAGQSALGTVFQTVLGEQSEGVDPRYYFYLAKVFASLGRPEDAVRNLRRSLEDGFGNLQKIREDPDLQKLNQFPAYIELLENPPVAIKH